MPRKWNGQPPIVEDPGNWPEVAKELMAHQREWFLVLENGDDGMAYRIARGKIKSFPVGFFEATSVVVPGSDPKRYDIYARYMSWGYGKD